MAFRLATRVLKLRIQPRINFGQQIQQYNAAFSKPLMVILPNFLEPRPTYHHQTLLFSTSRIWFEKQQSAMTEIKFEELKNLLAEKAVVLIDVREPKELVEDGKILGSLNVPLGEVESAFSLPAAQFESKYGGSLPSQEESSKLVLSCRSGKRAGMAFDKIKKLGYEQARVYSGSFQDWKANGGPLEKP